MNHELQETRKKAKHNHVHVQTQTMSKFECEQYYLENEINEPNEPNDIFNKLQKLIISSIENEKRILTNNMCNFQFQNAKEFLNLRKKQFNVNQSLRNLQFKLLDIEAIQNYNSDEQLKILLSNQINAIKFLYDNHTEALYDLRNEQSKALWSFNKTQCEDFKKFDIKQRESKFIKNFLCGQTNAKKNFQCIQTDNILKLQHEHNKLLWELKYEHNKALCELNLNEETKKLIDAIEESQTIYNKNIQNLELEQMKEIHILQFEQSNRICEYNLQYVNNVESLQIELLQPDNTKAYLKYMKKNVKKIIIKNLVDKKLTQENFDLSISEIFSNDQRWDKIYENDEKYNKYTKYNQIVQIVIFLYLTKEFNFKLKLNLISNTEIEFISSNYKKIKESKYPLNNSCLKYLKLVFPKLNNLKNLKIYNYDYNKWSLSLELFELLLLTNLESFKFKFIPSVIDFKLPEKKLKINYLNLEVINQSDNEKNNIFTFLKMCDYNIQKLKLSLFDTNNKYLLELGEELNKCNKLTDLRLMVEESDKNQELHFGHVISQCPNLINLNLSYNCIKNKEAINIAKILSNNTTLTLLDLSNNDIEDKEIEKIIEILSHNQRLKLFL